MIESNIFKSTFALKTAKSENPVSTAEAIANPFPTAAIHINTFTCGKETCSVSN
jgi:hypothetical protein